MSLFNFSESEILSFFAVIIRLSVAFAVIPIVGDRLVPAPLKVLLSLSVSIVLFPALVKSGHIRVTDATIWASTVGGLVGTLALEVAFGLLMGFIAKLAFDSISIGTNFVGTFMGFASASQFDPHQETQTEVIAQFQTVIAMLLFLSLDGHHLILKSVFESFRIIGIGKVHFSDSLANRLIEFSGEALKFGFQIAAPMAVTIFSVNVGLGVLSKAMPQLNILVLSFAITILAGLVVLFMGFSDFEDVVAMIFERSLEWLKIVMSLVGS